MGACGLICDECSIRRASFERDSAEEVKDWFVDMGWFEENVSVDRIMEEGPYCQGCKGSRENHWSPGCWILECCVDDKGLENCSQCDKFPCFGLEEWSKEDESYSKAFERLERILECS